VDQAIQALRRARAAASEVSFDLASGIREESKQRILGGEFPINDAVGGSSPSKYWAKKKQEIWKDVPHLSGATDKVGVFTGQMAHSMVVADSVDEQNRPAWIVAVQKTTHWRNLMSGSGDLQMQDINEIEIRMQEAVAAGKTSEVIQLMDELRNSLRPKGASAQEADMPLMAMWDQKMRDKGNQGFISRVFHEVVQEWRTNAREKVKSALTG